VANYNRGVNLASTIINDKLRISTASFPADDYHGGYDDALIETWVFSKDKRYRSRQIFSRTREHALMVHKLVAGIIGGWTYRRTNP
jgi:hypothetical protein